MGLWFRIFSIAQNWWVLPKKIKYPPPHWSPTHNLPAGCEFSWFLWWGQFWSHPFCRKNRHQRNQLTNDVRSWESRPRCAWEPPPIGTVL
jgi:hypothetical protein